VTPVIEETVVESEYYGFSRDRSAVTEMPVQIVQAYYLEFVLPKVSELSPEGAYRMR